MASLANLLKNEIQRLIRKEVTGTLRDLKKEAAGLRRTVAQQRKRIEALERGKARGAGKASVETPADVEHDAGPLGTVADRIRPTSRMIKGLRTKLGLTQAELAQLLGVSGQSVYQWERKDGAITLRSKTRRALVEVRGLGAREARRRLEAGG